MNYYQYVVGLVCKCVHKINSALNDYIKDRYLALRFKGVGRKFSRVGQRKKRPKISKKYRKIALFSSSRGGGATENKTEK